MSSQRSKILEKVMFVLYTIARTSVDAGEHESFEVYWHKIRHTRQGVLPLSKMPDI